ncbi:MAG: FAD-dependent oxidoreductase [Halanaeroarchaeum sp.]
MEDVSVPIRAVTDVGDRAVAITFESPPEFDGAPGQFVRLSAAIEGDVVQRFYTLSCPDVEETFEVTVAVDPEGSLGPWLAEREPGDTVQVSGPFGDHFYEDEERVTVIAAGPGIGPAVGIGERAVNEGAAVAIVYPGDIAIHRERLMALEEAGSLLAPFDVDLTDAVTTAVEGVGGTPFVYGFEGFVSDVANSLETAGIDPDDAKIESFGPGPDAD